MSYWGLFYLDICILIERIDLLLVSGYKFETLSLIPDVWDRVSRDYIENRERHVVSNIPQYCSVVQTAIGSTNLILGGEVDAGMELVSFCLLPMPNSLRKKYGIESLMIRSPNQSIGSSSRHPRRYNQKPIC
jgi:hypothetical protein